MKKGEMTCFCQKMCPLLERAILHFLLSRLEVQLVGIDSKEAHQAVDCLIALKEFLGRAWRNDDLP